MGHICWTLLVVVNDRIGSMFAISLRIAAMTDLVAIPAAWF
jgi:hypothetical protein